MMAMQNNNDDDSHTTLEGPEASSPSSSVDLLSLAPALSQHDAASGSLRYDMSQLARDTAAVAAAAAAASQQQIDLQQPTSKVANKEKDVASKESSAVSSKKKDGSKDKQEAAVATTITQDDARTVPIDKSDWDYLKLQLTEPGPLGMTIAKLVHKNGSLNVLVRKVSPNSSAALAGIQQGDLIDVATYEEVKTWIDSPRPQPVNVWRQRPKSVEEQEATSKAMEAFHAAVAAPPKTGQAPWDDDDTTVPFCKACRKNDSKHRMHHALCPKQAEFEDSGAKEKLQSIQRGVRLGCEACVYFYQNGRNSTDKPHALQCERHEANINKEVKAALKRDTPWLTTAMQPLKDGPTKKNATQDTATEDGAEKKKKARPKQQSEARSDKKAKSASSKKKKPTMAPKKRYMYESSDSESDQEEEKVAKRKSTGKVQESEDDNEKQDTRKLPAKKRKMKATAAKESCRKKTRLVTPSLSKKPKKSSSGFVKPNWVPCVNPWGPPGHVEGDVVLTCPSGGFTHHETLFPGERFTVSPFAPYTDYHDTHRSPYAGLHVFLLTRDAMAKQPWGFSFYRHEFGGACLVRSIDPHSPAAAAVYRGTTDMSGTGICVHDMIVCVNGKGVGGMTELGLAVELELCGRELELTVSRYKYPKKAAAQAMAKDREEWDSFDAAMEDKSRLDWHEVNAPSNENDVVSSQNDLIPTEQEKAQESLDADAGSMHPNEHISHVSFTQAHAGSPMSSIDTRRQFSPEKPACSQEKPASQRPDSPVARDENMSPTNSVPGEANDASQGEESQDWEQDDEAWLGCVCGETHSEPIPVFWIQCEDCQTWYDVAEKCVGFSQEQAEAMEKWSCPACSDSVQEEKESASSSKSTSSKRSKKSARKKAPTESASVAAGSEKSSKSSGANKGKSSGGANKGKYRDRRTRDEDLQRRTREDGCILPATAPKKAKDGTYIRSAGRTPAGTTWDAKRGLFVPKPKVAAAKMSAKKKKGSAVDTVKHAKKAKKQEETKEEEAEEADDATPTEKPKLLPVGTLVCVAERVWIGVNLLGGVGTVVDHRIPEDDPDNILYTVNYVLGGKEADIDAKWVSPHEFTGRRSRKAGKSMD